MGLRLLKSDGFGHDDQRTESTEKVFVDIVSSTNAF